MKSRILILDDDKTALYFLKNLLENHYEVDAFLSPTDAFEFLKKNKCQVIITDFKMPDMNGVEFTEKAIQLYPDVVPLLITAYGDDPQVTFNKCFFDIMKKPVGAEDVIKTVSRAFQEYNSST